MYQLEVMYMREAFNTIRSQKLRGSTQNNI